MEIMVKQGIGDLLDGGLHTNIAYEKVFLFHLNDF